MEILEVLCRRRSDTVENLANEFGVSKRTIKYDIEYLCLLCNAAVSRCRSVVSAGQTNSSKK